MNLEQRHAHQVLLLPLLHLSHFATLGRYIQQVVHRAEPLKEFTEQRLTPKIVSGNWSDDADAQLVAVADVAVLCFQDDCLIELVDNNFEAFFGNGQLTDRLVELGLEVGDYHQSHVLQEDVRESYFDHADFFELVNIFVLVFLAHELVVETKKSKTKRSLVYQTEE